MVQQNKNPSINKSQENILALWSWLVDSESESYFSCAGMWLWSICVNVMFMFNVQVRLEQRRVINNKDPCINLIFKSIKTIIIGQLMHYTALDTPLLSDKAWLYRMTTSETFLRCQFNIYSWSNRYRIFCWLSKNGSSKM